MVGLLKASALSAVLSFGVVTAINAPQAGSEAIPSTKIFHDRVAADGAPSPAPMKVSLSSGATATSTGKKGDRLAQMVPSNCEGQEWPYISAECLTREDGLPMPGRVRVITIEHRTGTNLSVLQRSNPTNVAQR